MAQFYRVTTDCHMCQLSEAVIGVGACPKWYSGFHKASTIPESPESRLKQLDSSMVCGIPKLSFKFYQSSLASIEHRCTAAKGRAPPDVPRQTPYTCYPMRPSCEQTPAVRPEVEARKHPRADRRLSKRDDMQLFSPQRHIEAQLPI